MKSSVATGVGITILVVCLGAGSYRILELEEKLRKSLSAFTQLQKALKYKEDALLACTKHITKGHKEK